MLDADGAVVDEHRLPTPSGSEAVVDVLSDVALELARRAADVGPVEAIGVGVPGLVDDRGVLRFAPNLPGVVQLDLGALLRDRLASVGVDRVVVENDASCAAWGEGRAGAAAGSHHALLVTLGTGIGGGLVLGGSLYRGANGFAGEIGHMIIDRHGPPCPCGQRGCWERFASGSGLGRLGREAAIAGRAPRVVELAGGDPEAVKGEHVTTAAAEGDEAAAAVMAEFAWYLALGLANLANALDPEVIVLGGGLIEAGAVLLDPVRSSFHALVEADAHRPDVPIVAAALGERAGAIGAALLTRS